MRTQSGYPQPRARIATRIQLPLDTTRLALPEPKTPHTRRAVDVVDNSPICGCLSRLSIPFVQRTDFRHAVAEFFELRQEATPAEYNHAAASVPQAFTSMADIEAATEVLDAMSRRQQIDSDLIEECGYFGWLA
ncbi:MAG: hypothetical protein ABW049_09680 [Spongiibacteraceae bacterium]